MKNAVKGTPDDEESESEEESDEEDDNDEEEDFIPLGNKRPRQSNGDSFAKKQKFDGAAGGLTDDCVTIVQFIIIFRWKRFSDIVCG